MANTEGLPDEAVASLLSPTPWPSSTRPKNEQEASARRKKDLERRMELPPGARPAARVTRSSRRGNAIAVPGVGPTEAFAQDEQEQEAPEEPEGPLPPVVGSIVERKVNNRSVGNVSQNIPGKQSRFARQRQQLEAPASGGFPSVNVPLGTFVKPKKKVVISAAPSASDTTRARAATGTAVPFTNTSDAGALEQATSQDAQAMLTGMSSSEIQDNVHELTSALSPETVAFLKKRGAAKKQQQQQSVAAASAKVPPVPTPTRAPQPTALTSKEMCTAEKDKLAQVLASVKTFQDLDAAYAAEMGGLALELGDASVVNAADRDDFAIATDLLRSTVPRQNLWAARVVHQRLEKDWAERKLCSVAGNDTPAWPYSTVLPVSLRCLLDASFMHVNGYVLHTYVLQSMYTLLRLRACVDHVVDVSGARETAASAYQECFLDDAVATPSLETCYPKAKVQPLSVGDNANVAYATSSTSASALTDGEAFANDPMWTLLSKMRIIPRLSQLLQGKDVPASLLPNEAIVATCGILAMLAQRSPGAASAIAQHPTLLGDLLELTLMPQDDMPHGGTTVALATVILLCTLARQSRAAATALKVDSILPRLLATKAADATEFKLQQWTLILWRTLLRYGACLTPLSTMLTLAAPHMTLGSAQPFSLSAEYFSAFANVLSCIRVIRRASVDEEKISEEQHTILSSASVWLSSTARLAIGHLESQAAVDPCEDAVVVSKLRTTTGCLRFMTSFIAMMDEDGATDQGEYKSEDVSDTEEAACLVALLALVKSDDVQHALAQVLPSATSAVLPTAIVSLSTERNGPVESATTDRSSLAYEAVTCAFLESIVTLLMAFANRKAASSNKESDQDAQKIDEHLSSMSELLCNLFIDKIQGRDDQSMHVPVSTCTTSVYVERARGDWYNRSHGAVFKFLARERLQQHHCTIQGVGCAVLGRLERGDEALAATMLSYDVLFSPRSVASSQSIPSPLSTMLVREMCRSPQGRSQLDHSFKLHNGLGITSAGLGPFDLQSLYSESESLGPGDASSELLLPMGRVWLWQILSGSVVAPETAESSEIPEQEAVEVLASCLEMLCDLEAPVTSASSQIAYADLEAHDASVSPQIAYANQLHPGAKLYHVMNVCFQPEGLMGNAKITAPAIQLLDKYTTKSPHMTSALEFAEACLLHSTSKPRASEAESADSTKLTESEEKIAAQLDPGEPTDTTLPKDAFRSLEALVSDLCVGYTTYGAQYPFFAQCLRAFLLPAFPDKIRCEVLRSLRGMLQLFTLSNEDESKGATLLHRSILGGVYDGSKRDSPMILDCLVETLCFEKDNVQFDQGYVPFLAVALLSRSLAISVTQPGSSGLIATKRRIQSLPTAWSVRIVNAAAEMLVSGANGNDVAIATMSVFDPGPKPFFSLQDSQSSLDDAIWDDVLSKLKSCSGPSAISD